MAKYRRMTAAVMAASMVFSMSVFNISAAEPPDKPPGEAGGGMSAEISYSAVDRLDEDTEISGESVESTGKDECAVLTEDGTTVITDSEIIRENSSSTGGDNSSFYGVGAAALATGGKLLIGNSEITTAAKGGAGVFAYDGSKVYVADSTIRTSESCSGGIHAAGGGCLYAWNLDVKTEGESSAAIRSDRGGGTMVVDGGSYVSSGKGSPAIYCTADISVKDASLNATGSEAFCLEGLNTTRLYDCSLKGNMPDDSQNDNTWTVIVYQSMSGDSEEGKGTFEMDGGSLESENGGLFYTTNTESSFTLRNVDISASEDSEYFLRCTGNSNERGWGSEGSNGADCIFTGINQKMNGDIIWDSISSLKLYITEGSELTGSITDDESCAGNGGDGSADVYISEDSKWIVTGDSKVTSLNNEGTIEDEEGNTVTVKDSSGKILAEGESEYVITAESYEAEADLSDAGTISSWEDCSVERPDELGASVTEASVSADVLHMTLDGEAVVIGSEGGIDYDGYEIKKSIFSFIFLGSDDSASSEYVDEKAREGSSRWYKVRGYIDIDGTKCYSPWTDAIRIEY